MLTRVGISGPVLALVVLSLPGPLVASSFVPFRLADRYVLVSVRINGEHDATFVLDTASSVTLISPRLAGHLKLPLNSGRRVVTQTGVEEMPQGALHALEIGPLKVANLSVIVAKLTPLTTVAPAVDGVLGQDVLGGTNYLVDYRRSIIEFDRGRRLVRALVGTALPVVRVGRRLLVKATLIPTPNALAVPVLLALDSAASAVMVFNRQDGAGTAVQFGGRTKAVWVHSVEGEQMGVKGVVEEIAVGGQLLRRVPVTVLDMPLGWQDNGQHGLLPTALFESIYFDNEGHRVILSPQRLERTVATDDDSDAGSGDGPARRPPPM